MEKRMDLSQANRLAEMALDMTEQPDVASTLEHIMANARSSMSSEAAGVQLIGDGGAVETAAATSELVRRADELQVECGEGPCVTGSGSPGAQLAGDVVLISEARQDTRFPRWGPRVADLGFQAVLSVRLSTPVRTVGALNLYSRFPGAFSRAHTELAEIFGRHASIALMSAQYGDSLRAAVDSRHVIGQAQGILMERYQVDAHRAFEVLRRYSQTKNIKLRTIAEHVISHHRLPE